MNTARCYHCKKAIRSLAKAEFFALVPNKRTGEHEETYIHKRCLRAFNGEEAPSAKNSQ